jgi:hypothetical protein
MGINLGRECDFCRLSNVILGGSCLCPNVLILVSKTRTRVGAYPYQVDTLEHTVGD